MIRGGQPGEDAALAVMRREVRGRRRVRLCLPSSYLTLRLAARLLPTGAVEWRSADQMVITIRFTAQDVEAELRLCGL